MINWILRILSTFCCFISGLSLFFCILSVDNTVTWGILSLFVFLAGLLFYLNGSDEND